MARFLDPFVPSYGRGSVEKFTPLETIKGDEYFSQNEKTFRCMVDDRIGDEHSVNATICDVLEEDFKCMFALHLLKLMDQTTIDCSDGRYELERIFGTNFKLQYRSATKSPSIQSQSYNTLTCIELAVVPLGKKTGPDTLLCYTIPIEQIHIVYDKVNKFSHVKVSMGMVERYPKVCIVFAVKVILAIAGNISHFQWDPMTAIRTRQDRLAINIVLSEAEKNNEKAVWERKMDIIEEFQKLTLDDFEQRKMFFIRLGVSPKSIQRMETALRTKSTHGSMLVWSSLSPLRQNAIHAEFVGVKTTVIEKYTSALSANVTSSHSKIQIQGEALLIFL